MAYSFLMSNMIWRSTEVALARSIKEFLENKDSDTFEDCIKYNKLPNINLQIAKEIDIWYEERR